MTAANVNRAASATKFTGATFTALAVPLALFGAQPIDLSFAGATIRGQLDDYAMEYLGAAAVLSLGLGISRLGKGTGAAPASSAPLVLAPVQLAPSLASADSSLLTEDKLRASGLHLFLENDDAPLVARPAPELSAAAQAASAQQSSVNTPIVSDAGEESRLDSRSTVPVTPDLSAAAQSQVPSAAADQAPLAAQPALTTVQADPSVSPVPAPVNQPAHSGSDTAADSLANIVAEVQAIAQQLAVHSPQQTDTGLAEAPLPIAPAAFQPAVQVAALPLVGSSATYHQPGSYYSVKRQPLNRQPVGSHQVNGNSATSDPSAHSPIGDRQAIAYQAGNHQSNSHQLSDHQTSGHRIHNRQDVPILPAAQAYVSFARPQAVVEPPAAQRFSTELAALEQVYQVREQMQNLMSQLDLIQANLEQTVYPAQRLVPFRVPAAPSYTVSAVEPVRAAVAEQMPDSWAS